MEKIIGFGTKSVDILRKGNREIANIIANSKGPIKRTRLKSEEKIVPNEEESVNEFKSLCLVRQLFIKSMQSNYGG